MNSKEVGKLWDALTIKERKEIILKITTRRDGLERKIREDWDDLVNPMRLAFHKFVNEVHDA